MWVSRQYPGEKEVTFPPYTCLESHGDPRVEQTTEGELIIFPLKVPPPRFLHQPFTPTHPTHPHPLLQRWSALM